MLLPPPTPNARTDGAANARPHRLRLVAVAVGLLVLLLVRCVSHPAPKGSVGTIEVAGQPFPIGTVVVNWRQSPCYDAYQRGKRFSVEDPPDGAPRYGVRKVELDGDLGGTIRSAGLDLQALQRVVHQFVLHYDVAGVSRRCFKILQDDRQLSVHFLLDVDGTIYQTLDLREKASHATIANDVSIGVEIAHPGAYPQPLHAEMRRWYEKDGLGYRMIVPAWVGESGIRTPGFVARPARPELVEGSVQGRTYYQFDFTTEQYTALAHLCAALHAVFPRIRLEVPRDAAGNVIPHALPEAELRAFDGIVGHFHVQKNKQDPGPAMQWDRVLRDARRIHAQRDD